jgi:hypothetical protein
MDDPVGKILEELGDDKLTQDGIAVTYAFIIAQKGDGAPWPLINQRIKERWPSKSGLVRVKEKAWKYVDDWNRAGRP